MRADKKSPSSPQYLLAHPRSGATAIDANPFIETTLAYALTYISKALHQRPSHTMTPAKLTILADSSYYSAPDPSSSSSAAAASSPAAGARFVHMQTTLKDAKKTGLGSSAALVTSLTAALLSQYLGPAHFDLATDQAKAVLHNLAQTAHCRAQGKIGSGFDVAAAVYGSCLYRRFSPSVLDAVPHPGQPSFASRLVDVVDGPGWDTEVRKDAVALPAGVAMRMCDVDCGSQTVGMVKAVNAWRARDPAGAKQLWAELQRRNGVLAGVLATGQLAQLPAALAASRELVRKMGAESGVPIEPESQTELIDALTNEVDGVYGGVVPGAGGFDAVALLLKDDEDTAKRVDAFLAEWSQKKGAKVKLLGVRGELEGVRSEKLSEFNGWLS